MLVEEIQTALANEHSEAIYRMIREHHPADIALALEELEDEEDSREIERIMNDLNTKFSTGIEDLAKESGIDYEAL